MIQTIIKGVKKKYPEAKFIPSPDIDLVDDTIHLDEKKHIQCCVCGGFEVVEEIDGCYKFTTANTPEEIFKVLKIN